MPERNPTAMTVTRDLVDYHHRTVDNPAESAAWATTLNQWPGLRHLIEKAVKIRELADRTSSTERGPVAYIWVGGEKVNALNAEVGSLYADDSGQRWRAGREDDQRATWRRDEEAADPAYSTGRVDFSEMLTQDYQWSLKHQFDALLGRPYLSTQLAALLPADVALRLADRLTHVVEERVRGEVDRIQDDITNATATTLARMAATTDKKLEELRNERYKPTRLS